VWREIFGARHGGDRRRTKQLGQIRNSPTAFGAAGLVVLELRLFIIVVQVALADYCFRVCLFSRDDVFQWSFRLSWIDQRQIARCRDATRVCQCRVQVGGIPPAEIVRFQSAIRCRLRLSSFCSAESPFRGRDCWEIPWAASYSQLNAVLPQVCRAALVRLSHRAKLLRQVNQHRLAARLRLRLLSPRRQ